MLLSFKPEVHEKIKNGVKIYEHRRNFPDEPIMAYMYVSSPVKAITGIVYLDNRHDLSQWKKDYAYNQETVTRIEKYEESYRYALEILEFQETSKISLNELRKNVAGFVAPQMYFYLDNTELLQYIESIIEYRDINIRHAYLIFGNNKINENIDVEDYYRQLFIKEIEKVNKIFGANAFCIFSKQKSGYKWSSPKNMIFDPLMLAVSNYVIVDENIDSAANQEMLKAKYQTVDESLFDGKRQSKTDIKKRMDFFDELLKEIDGVKCHEQN